MIEFGFDRPQSHRSWPVLVFRDDKRNPTERELATSVLARYMASDASALVDLINDAQPEQFHILFPALEKQRDKAIGLLAAELEKKAAPNWNEPPLDPAWGELPAEVVARIEGAEGLVAERFAFCQALPLKDFEPLAAEMGKCGYRPLRLRPYSTGERVSVSAVWRRDGLDWQVAHDLSADKLLARDKQFRAEKSCPWMSPDTYRFAGVTSIYLAVVGTLAAPKPIGAACCQK